MNSEEKDRALKALEEKSAKLPCPRCGNAKFFLADGYFNQSIQENLEGITIGGPSIPSVGVVCAQCGFISHHALGVLGLLPTPKTFKK